MIIATLATIPEREEAVARAVDSLLHQVDDVLVWENRWEDLGDAGKFAFSHEIDGYHLVCDDDLEYADGYAAFMVEAVERYDGAVVSLHGRSFSSFPIESYYRTPSARVRCLGAQDKDVPVQFPGSGVMCYHTDAITFSLDNFPQSHRNMADIHVGVKCLREGVEVIALAHPEGMVRHLPIDMTTTIHHRHKDDDQLQTELVNSIEWHTFA